MSGIFGNKSGGGGGLTGPITPDATINVPPFTSSGGVTPEQQTLANYGLGQDLLAQGNMFGNERLGQSTMATQAAGGARNTMAQQLGKMSDTNQGAQYDLYLNDVNALQTQLQNEATLNQANNASSTASLANLANLAGFFTGSGGTGGGATGG